MPDRIAQIAKQGEIPAGIEQLRSAVDALEKTADRLADKLANTLRPSVPTNASSQGSPPSASQIGESISDLTIRVSSISGAIQDLIDRCEL